MDFYIGIATAVVVIPGGPKCSDYIISSLCVWLSLYAVKN